MSIMSQYTPMPELMPGGRLNKSYPELGRCITQEEYDMYQKIRKRRNEITHELMKNLSDGFKESDIELFAQMVSIYTKMDKWWINEIEIPISAEEIPEDYDMDGVCGGQAIILSIINSIILEDKGKEYKQILEAVSKL